MPEEIIEAVIETTEAAPRRYRCRRIFTDGSRCGSPCLRGEEFCYYHHTALRAARTRAHDLRDSYAIFELPLPEDRTAIQTAIGEVLQRIAGSAIDTKRAGLLLYGLQIASSNLPKNNPADQDATPIEHVVVHPRLGRVASRAIVGAPEEVVEEEIPEEQTGTEAREEEAEEPRLSQYTVAEAEEMYRRAALGLPPIPQPVLPNLQATAAEPQNRVPHLRDGSIVAKVGEAAQIHPETSYLHPEPGPKPTSSRHQTHISSPAKNSRHLDRSSAQSHRALRSGETPVFRRCFCPYPISEPAAPAPTQQITANSCYPDLNHVKQTNRSYHPRRLGLPRRDQRQRHRACPQAHLRQAADHLSQHAHPRQ